MLSFAYGWYDLEAQEIGPIKCVSLGQDRKFRAGSTNDSYVVSRLWRLFDQAQVIVGQNHERFDIKRANERFFVHGFTPPSPSSTIDTKRVWNKYMSGSASLKYMARKADVALKGDAGGFATWLGCMGNVEAAWKRMEEYNIADVAATAGVFTKLIPWIEHPTSNVVNFGHWKPGLVTCKKCGNAAERDDIGSAFVRRGFHGTGASRFQTLRCRKCGGYSRWWQREPQRRPEDKVYLR